MASMRLLLSLTLLPNLTMNKYLKIAALIILPPVASYATVLLIAGFFLGSAWSFSWIDNSDIAFMALISHFGLTILYYAIAYCVLFETTSDKNPILYVGDGRSCNQCRGKGKLVRWDSFDLCEDCIKKAASLIK